MSITRSWTYRWISVSRTDSARRAASSHCATCASVVASIGAAAGSRAGSVTASPPCDHSAGSAAWAGEVVRPGGRFEEVVAGHVRQQRRRPGVDLPRRAAAVLAEGHAPLVGAAAGVEHVAAVAGV